MGGERVVLDVSGDWNESVDINFNSSNELVFNRLVNLVRVSTGRGLYDHEIVDCIMALGLIGNRLIGGKCILLSDTDPITLMKAFIAEGFSVEMKGPVLEYDSSGEVRVPRKKALTGSDTALDRLSSPRMGAVVEDEVKLKGGVKVNKR